MLARRGHLRRRSLAGLRRQDFGGRTSARPAGGSIAKSGPYQGGLAKTMMSAAVVRPPCPRRTPPLSGQSGHGFCELARRLMALCGRGLPSSAMGCRHRQ